MQATLCTPRSIDASAHCMLALNNQGRILLNKNTPAPKKIESPDLFHPLFAGAATVSAGHAHWGAVMDTGEICMQGEGRDGQLGHGSNGSENDVQHVIFLYRVKAVGIACGAAHTLLLDENGRVWGTGTGLATGRPAGGNAFQRLVISSFAQKPVKAIRANGNSSAAVTTDGDLYTWGAGKYGVRGTGLLTDCWIPGKVDLPTEGDEEICAVSLGWYHVAVATMRNVYTWGRGTSGQLGLGTWFSQNFPIRVPLYVGFVDVACGDHMTLGLSLDGQLWSTGRAISLLGSGNLRSMLDKTQFQRVVVPDDVRFCEVSVGCSAALARTADGMLYRWGVSVSLSSVRNFETPHREEALVPEHVIGRLARRELEPCAMLAVCMATHARLGKASRLYWLDQEILRKIVQEYAAWMPCERPDFSGDFV